MQIPAYPVGWFSRGSKAMLYVKGKVIPVLN